MTISTSDINSLQGKFSLLYNNKLINELAKMYHDGAHVVIPHSPKIIGRANITESFINYLESGADKFITESTNIMIFDDYAIETGKYTVFGCGNTTIDLGRYQLLWKHINGEIVIENEIATSTSIKEKITHPADIPDRFMETFSERAYRSLLENSYLNIT
ncbi:hypothetical protein [Roseibium sp. RKSG952]|uniref:YybH family protein n=1 Tax=Roseibium sp. RKSG952 TaxID=2529384 RepID=UPI0012BC1DE1|nr:hypothetical protein [Roseibium sp. RKSG952]MTI00172.1 hypothetical protein [Roseibium sp. RKSG952]